MGSVCEVGGVGPAGVGDEDAAEVAESGLEESGFLRQIHRDALELLIAIVGEMPRSWGADDQEGNFSEILPWTGWNVGDSR